MGEASFRPRLIAKKRAKRDPSTKTEDQLINHTIQRATNIERMKK